MTTNNSHQFYAAANEARGIITELSQIFTDAAPIQCDRVSAYLGYGYKLQDWEDGYFILEKPISPAAYQIVKINSDGVAIYDAVAKGIF